MDKESIRVGRQIRDLRKAKGATLQQMADHIGRSVGYVSQVERGVSSLPVPVLQSISDLLGVKIAWFFHSDADQPDQEYARIVRRQSRRTLDFAGTGIHEELLSPTLTGDLLMVLTKIAPLAKTDPAVRKREAEEGGVIIAGVLQLSIDDQTFELRQGDSFRIQPHEEYRCFNPSDCDTTEIVWVLSSQAY